MSYSQNIELSIFFKINQRTRTKVERASNELTSDKVSNSEQDPESDAK